MERLGAARMRAEEAEALMKLEEKAGEKLMVGKAARQEGVGARRRQKAARAEAGARKCQRHMKACRRPMRGI